MSDQNQPETPATPDQLQTPQWAQVSDATEAIPAELTAQQPEVVGSLSGEPTAEEASVSQAAPVIPPVPVQPAAAAAALPAAPARARWSVKKGLLVGAAALGIATVGAAGVPRPWRSRTMTAARAPSRASSVRARASYPVTSMATATRVGAGTATVSRREE